MRNIMATGNREPFVSEAVGARMRKVGEDRWSVEFLDGAGGVRAVRPASDLEVRMWGLLCTADKDWRSAYAPQSVPGVV